MPFRDLVNQRHAVLLLRAASRRGHVSHAYLFAGPAGVGRSEAAVAFAQLLNCQRPAADDACGECRPCRLIGSGQHPDVRTVDVDRGLLLDPQDTTRTVIGIDQVRALRRDVSFPPLEGRAKVYIFAGADRMQPDAANSLLKILEEPPPQVVIILIAESTVPMLPTVVSRCQLVRFSLIPAPEIEQALTRRAVDPARARFISILAGGQLGKAVTWAASPEALRWREQALDLLEQMETADLLERLDAAEVWAKDKDRLADLLDAALFWYRDALVFQELADPTRLINLDRADRIAALAASLPGPLLSQRIRALEEAKDDLRRNVHARLLLEHLFLQLAPPGEPAARGKS